MSARRKPQPTPPAPAATSPQRVALGSTLSSGQTLRRTLDRAAERMTRRMRPLLEPLLRCNLRIEAAPATLLAYREWTEAQPRFVGLVQLCLEPAGLPLLVAVPAAAVHDAVDRFFGGEGGAESAALSDFTTAEERMLLRIASALAAQLGAELALDGGGEAVVRSHETNPVYAMFAEASENVAMIAFSVTLADDSRHALTLLLSPALLRAIEGEARSTRGPDAAGGSWGRRLFDSAASMHFDARVVVARPQISLDQLLRLKAGDVLPTIVPSVVPLIVAGRTIAHGTIGESDGRAALRIERLERKGLYP